MREEAQQASRDVPETLGSARTGTGNKQPDRARPRVRRPARARDRPQPADATEPLLHLRRIALVLAPSSAWQDSAKRVSKLQTFRSFHLTFRSFHLMASPACLKPKNIHARRSQPTIPGPLLAGPSPRSLHGVCFVSFLVIWLPRGTTAWVC